MNISWKDRVIIVKALQYFIDEVDFPDSILKEDAREAREIIKKFEGRY